MGGGWARGWGGFQACPSTWIWSCIKEASVLTGRKPGGRQGEKMSPRGPDSLREVVAGDGLSRQNEKARRSAERGPLLGVQAVEL